MSTHIEKPYLLVLAFCVIALALRVAIANDAFWLDEIWSYRLTQLMTSSLDALTVLQIDNNHLLNTLTMYWLGEQANWSVYRLPAVVSGVGLVALMYPAARLICANPWIAMLLTTISLPLIQYSAEARGYSSAALFGLASWYIYCAHLRDRQTLPWLLVFWCSSLLGLISHLTYTFVLVALCLTWLIELLRHWQQRTQVLRTGLIVLLPVVALFGWLYAYFYSQASVGGGETSLRLTSNLLNLIGLMTGAPDNTASQFIALILLLVVVFIALRKLDPQQQWFFALIVFLVPGTLLTVYQPEFFYPRYLFVCLPFAYLLLANGLGNLLLNGAAAKIAGTVALAAILIGSAFHYQRLLQWGKGDYPQAVSDLFADTDAQRFTIGSDFDFRNQALLDFYTRYRDDADRLVYVTDAHTQTQPTDYFIVHNQQQGESAKQNLTLNQWDYQLIGDYPYYGLSGWNWYVYRYSP